MHTKHYISFIIITILIACSATKPTSEQTKPNAKKQNVLFIAIDDLKPLLNCYGNPHIKTPNIDRLAKMGTVFQNNHCQQAVCGPSRVSILTGKVPDNTKVWDLQTYMRVQNPNIVTLPQYFKSQGYESVGMGKIFHSAKDKANDEISWSEPFVKVVEADYASGKEPVYGHYQKPQNRKKYNELRKEAKAKNKKPRKYMIANFKPATEKANVADDVYLEGVLAKKGVEYLNKFSKSDKPFFLAVGFKKPHLPFVAPKKYWDLYSEKDIQLAEYQGKVKGGFEKAYHTMGEISKYTNNEGEHIYKNLIDRKLSEAEQRELIHGYYACVSFVDAQVGKLLDALEANRQDKNTTIVLWGDHGWHLGDHGLWCKHSNFEQATRSPLIIATPNGKANSTTTPTGFVDVFPTLCELSNIPTPTNLDGESLVSIMQNPTENTRQFTVSQYPRGKQMMGYAVRSEHYRYVHWVKMDFHNNSDYSKAEVVATELYDYRNDANETVNIAESNEKIVAEHRAMLESYFERIK
ncbi:MAG: sulfatase [Saprospiraceae bacterium]